jgi:hypothetical protein
MHKPPSRLEFEVIYWTLVAQTFGIVLGGAWLMFKIATGE